MNIHEWIQQGSMSDDIAKKRGLMELVRCRDCVYWQDNNSGYPHIGCKWRDDETPESDDFCSAGERRTE